MPASDKALPGRNEKMPVTNRHFINGNCIKPPFATGLQQVLFGLGCFWGAEKKFWQVAGVHTTAVGYAGGYTLNPNYEEVCTGLTGHCEVVMVVYDPARLDFADLLAVFWESHDPTQGMRQGNDVGTQYRSAIYTSREEQYKLALQSKQNYQSILTAAGYQQITTEIRAALEFYYAEDYHQQYLAKHPEGYCGLGGTGLSYKPLATSD